MSPLIVWIALQWTHSEFQVNILVITEILQNVKVFLNWKRGIILKKKNAFWIISLNGRDCSLDSEYIYSKFQGNIFSNNKQQYYKMSKLLQDNDNNAAKAIAILRVFSKNSRAENVICRWPYRSWDENFTKILKYHPYTPKAFWFSVIEPR